MRWLELGDAAFGGRVRIEIFRQHHVGDVNGAFALDNRALGVVAGSSGCAA